MVDEMIYKTISEIQKNLIRLTNELQNEKELLVRLKGNSKTKREAKLLYYTNLINHVFMELGYEHKTRTAKHTRHTKLIH